MSVKSEDVVILSIRSSTPTSSLARHPLEIVVKWWREARRLKTEAHVYYCVFKDSGTPWYAKIVAACTAGYLLSPIQLIPNYIPVIGCLDDLLVLFLGAKLIHKLTPSRVIADCRDLVEAAEAQGLNEPKSVAGTIALLLVIAIWLILGIVGTTLVVSLIRRWSI